MKDIEKEKIISPTLTARGAGEDHSGMVLVSEQVDNYVGTYQYAKSENFMNGKDRFTPNKETSDINILWNAYFPLLKENEGESLCFYRCSSKKVTVGYGCNIEENPHLLKDIQVYKDNKPISIQDHKKLLSSLKTKDEKEISFLDKNLNVIEIQKENFELEKANNELIKFEFDELTHYTINISLFTLKLKTPFIYTAIFYNSFH